MVQRDIGTLVRLVMLLYASGDAGKLAEIWHDDIEATTFMTPGHVRGKAALTEYCRALIEDHRVHLAPESVRIAGHSALIDGSILFSDERPPVPVTWMWTFEDGLLWRSLTFERNVAPERPSGQPASLHQPG
jgi:hypothetical protein